MTEAEYDKKMESFDNFVNNCDPVVKSFMLRDNTRFDYNKLTEQTAIYKSTFLVVLRRWLDWKY